MKSEDFNLEHYRLIVSDIDGTLMGRDHIIHPLTKEVVFRLRQEGFTFTLATGKNLPATVSQADELEVDLPLILTNGCRLQTRHGKVVDNTTLRVDIIHRVIEICEEREKDLVIYIDDAIYMKEMNENVSLIYGHLPSGVFEVGEWDAISDKLARANKCLVVDSYVRENLFKIGEVFEDTLKDQVDVLHTSTALVEVMPRGVTKVSGIQKLAKSMGIPMGAIMAFGDFDNDAEMLAAVGLGAAVKNASPRAIAAADLVIGSVDDQGPAMFLKGLLDRFSGR